MVPWFGWNPNHSMKILWLMVDNINYENQDGNSHSGLAWNPSSSWSPARCRKHSLASVTCLRGCSAETRNSEVCSPRMSESSLASAVDVVPDGLNGWEHKMSYSKYVPMPEFCDTLVSCRYRMGKGAIPHVKWHFMCNPFNPFAAFSYSLILARGGTLFLSHAQTIVATAIFVSLYEWPCF